MVTLEISAIRNGGGEMRGAEESLFPPLSPVPLWGLDFKFNFTCTYRFPSIVLLAPLLQKINQVRERGYRGYPFQLQKLILFLI
jgi:hypothetical protein